MNTPGRYDESGANFGRYALEQHSYQVLFVSQSQAAFATPSISDRIAFALWSRRNRTARVLAREKRCKAQHQHRTVHFLRSGFRARIAKLRRLLATSKEIEADFSPLQTVWRSKQDSNPRSGFAALSRHKSVSCR